METIPATDAAVEAAARQYYGAQSLEYPGDAEIQARFRASWDEGRVQPHIMEKCRDTVRPVVFAALTVQSPVKCDVSRATTLTTTGAKCTKCVAGRCRYCDGCAWDGDQPTNCACSLAGH